MLDKIRKIFTRNYVEEKFFSQYGQDQWLYENFFSKSGGVFVEVGADDGIDKSNTYFFEKELGWTGLCIEPSPTRYRLLRENRACFCEEIAISDKAGIVDFLEIRGWGKGLSGIVENYDPKHVSRIDRELEHPENRGHSTVQVRTELMSKILQRHEIDRVDFCTIDTEGSEAQVLSSIDFDRCHFNMILVENNYEDKQVEQLLSSKGFVKIAKVGIDDAYAHTSFDLGAFTKDI